MADKLFHLAENLHLYGHHVGYWQKKPTPFNNNECNAETHSISTPTPTPHPHQYHLHCHPFLVIKGYLIYILYLVFNLLMFVVSHWVLTTVVSSHKTMWFQLSVVIFFTINRNH